MKMKKNDALIFDFFEKKGGYLFVVSDDPLFYRTIRALLGKALAVKRECMFHFHKTSEVAAEVRQQTMDGSPVVVFLERILQGAPTADFIASTKKAFPTVKIIVLTEDTLQERLVYLHEMGADSFVAKPASVNDLVEKMAQCMQPQGKLGRMVQLGKQLMAQGDVEKALAVGNSILEIKPDHAGGHMLCGEAKLRLGRKEDAVASLEEASNASGLFLDPLKKLAELFRDEDEDVYLNYLKKLDQLSPLNTMRKADIGKVYANKKELGKAEQYFDQAVDLASKEAKGLISNVVEEIADSLATKSPAMAEKYLNNVLEMKGARLGREDMGAFNRLGMSLRRQGKWREAIENYQKALDIAGEDEGLHYNMGMAYMEGGCLQEALAAFRRALQLNPKLVKNNSTICYNVGYAYAKTKQPGEAIFYLKKALAIKPDHASAARLLAQMQAKADDSQNMNQAG
jgi:tetratricopeptide (TPR) repeat protein